MSQSAPSSSERDNFEKELQAVSSAMLVPVKYLFDHAPPPMNSVAFIRAVLHEHDSVVRLLQNLQDHINPTDLAPSTETNSKQCDVWSFFGFLLMLQGREHQALEAFDALYSRMLTHQSQVQNRFHKGLPLFRISQCHQRLGHTVHAKRYMMLTLCEDAITGGGKLNLPTTGSYAMLAGHYGLPDGQIRAYAARSHQEYTANQLEGAMPEWVLQQLDTLWTTEIPSAHETGVYHVTRSYCEFLLGKLGAGDGKDLERLGTYLVSAMPGCRAYRRARTFSTDHDIIVSVEGFATDFRSELGRYFVCECKDKQEDKASFAEIAKFCRVLDSVKAKFGVVFSTTGHSGAGRATDADREIQKVYQDRGIVIVVIDRDDLQRVAEGANFISMLREKYEVVRLDLRQPAG